MILYKPTDGDVQTTKIEYRPKTCFIITQLGEPFSPQLIEIRNKIKNILNKNNINEIDASSVITGKDFLLKIWQLIISVPLGIAIIDETMSPKTLENIFYEIGMMHALGKEIVVVKTEQANVPSDFVRTEYITYNSSFISSFNKFFDTFWKVPKYYETIAEQLEKNPLLSIDYLRRAYLITGDDKLRRKVKKIFRENVTGERAKNSVEQLLIDF
jgi:hypothetical protein